MKKQLTFYGYLLLFLLTNISVAATYRLPPPGNDVIGRVYYTQSLPGETLAGVGRRHDIGNYEMVVANPSLSSVHQLRPRTKVLIPGQFILPDASRTGIVINLAELRLYYYPPGRNTVITEPVGIGREGGWSTPVGTTTITKKVKNPSWRPTKDVRKEAWERYRKRLPTVMDANDPENPLGEYAFRLGWPSYLIHGTIQPPGVGQRSSAGCIRMFPEDIEELYYKVKVGTKVRVVHQPVKLGWANGRLFLEAHKPLIDQDFDYQADMVPIVNNIHQLSKGRKLRVHWTVARNTVMQHVGIPTLVGS